jgi:hypothetical protein
MRVWAVVLVAAVALSGCADNGSVGRDESGEPAPLGNTTLFCRVWPDARLKLMNVVSGETVFGYQQDEIGLSLFLEDVDSAVPAEVRDEWDQAYATYSTVADLAFVTGYSEGMIRAAHLRLAFGDAGPERAATETEATIGFIDDWAATACGNFCSRWPDFERIMGFEEEQLWRDLRRHIDADEALIAVGDRLVPDEVVSRWKVLADLQRGFFALGRSVDFDVENRPDGDAWTSLVEQYLGMWFDDARMASDEARETIGRWVEGNCDATAAVSGTAGDPGSVALWLRPQPQTAGQLLVAALLPPGTDFATNRSPGDLIAGRCTEANFQPGEWEWMLDEAARAATESGVDPEGFMKEHFAHQLSRLLFPVHEGQEVDYADKDFCGFVGSFSEEDAALVPSGTYELFIGTYNGSPGAYGLYSSAPEYCAQIPVTVSGDTVVDIPQLEACSLKAIGRPEEIARRTPPPFEPGGTLQIEVPSPVQSEDYDHCNLTGSLLPAGTTLNDVGRGDIWPSGVFNLARPNIRMLEEGGEQRWVEIPGLVPILDMPPAGHGGNRLMSDFANAASWDSAFPAPTPLAAGAYDLRIEHACENEDAHDEGDMFLRCGFVTVEVSGATIVKMPVLGACP